MGDERVVINKELEDILENETKYDSDGVARGRDPDRPPSASGSVGSVGSGASSGSGSRGKRRTWKKPKDKPKRPLSAYNIFFKHERSRIVEGREDNPAPDEIVRSIEQILSTSRETRRHRKTHGRISFGDLARKIAEKWKTVDKERKAVFEHYAELDMRRYRKELKMWKDKKDALSNSTHEEMNNSMSSGRAGVPDDDSDLGLDQLGHSNHSAGGGPQYKDAWGARYSMNSSFSSIESSEGFLEPLPINDMMNKGNATMPNLGMEVGVPVPGIVPSNGMQMNSNGLQNMQNIQTMQNMQPADVRLFNQQQQLLNNMHFGAGQQQLMMQQQMGQMGQQMGQMNFQGPNELQQQRKSLEEQRQQLMLLQQQQQLLQQQLMQQQNALRMQQGSLAQQQADFAMARANAMNHPGNPSNMNQPPVTMSRPNVAMSQPSAGNNQSNNTHGANEDGDLLENFISNLDLSNV